jgi:hypothetical protein
MLSLCSPAAILAAVALQVPSAISADANAVSSPSTNHHYALTPDGIPPEEALNDIDRPVRDWTLNIGGQPYGLRNWVGSEWRLCVGGRSVRVSISSPWVEPILLVLVGGTILVIVLDWMRQRRQYPCRR